MILFLAFRNIIKNIKNSFIVIILIAVITFLFFIGNTVIEKASLSIRQAYIESLTGDVVIQKAGELSMNFFGANIPIIDEFFNIPVLPAYDLVMDIVANKPGVAGVTSMVSGRAVLVLQQMRPALLCGIDADTYFPLFPGIRLEEGRFLKSGEFGAMITTEWARIIKEDTGQYPFIGKPLLFASAGDAGFKIREVPLVGIFSYINPGPLMDRIILIDPQTVRVLNSIQVAGGVQPCEHAITLLDIDLDDIFSESFFIETTAGNNEEFSAGFLSEFLRESRYDEGEPEAGGDWNFIIISLENRVSAPAFIRSLNRQIESFGLVAVNWRTAAGGFAILVLLLHALFNAGIFLVSVVCVIASVNILLIAVFRRTAEIGTLRAIGASDFYIRCLIFSENFLIAFFAGLAGILSGLFVLNLLNSLEIQITNALVASLLGGTVLQLAFLPGIAVFSFFVAVLLGLVASFYPVETAVRIQPMAALRK